jgi:hypothetical protein
MGEDLILASLRRPRLRLSHFPVRAVAYRIHGGPWFRVVGSHPRFLSGSRGIGGAYSFGEMAEWLKALPC